MKPKRKPRRMRHQEKRHLKLVKTQAKPHVCDCEKVGDVILHKVACVNNGGSLR